MNKHRSLTAAILLCIALASVLPLFGGTLEGRLYEGLSSRPIGRGGHVFALVVAEDRSFSIVAHAPITDATGRWRLPNVPDASSIRLVGFHERAPASIWMEDHTVRPGNHNLGVKFTQINTGFRSDALSLRIESARSMEGASALAQAILEQWRRDGGASCSDTRGP